MYENCSDCPVDPTSFGLFLIWNCCFGSESPFNFCHIKHELDPLNFKTTYFCFSPTSALRNVLFVHRPAYIALPGQHQSDPDCVQVASKAVLRMEKNLLKHYQDLFGVKYVWMIPLFKIFFWGGVCGKILREDKLGTSFFRRRETKGCVQ